MGRWTWEHIRREEEKERKEKEEETEYNRYGILIMMSRLIILYTFIQGSIIK
jgi:hypothetical protein